MWRLPYDVNLLLTLSDHADVESEASGHRSITIFGVRV